MLINTIKGMSIVSVGLFLTKLFSLTSFYFVGRYLSDDQIGTYASVLGIIGILISYQNGSIEPLIIQRKVYKRRLHDYYISYALTINLLLVFVGLSVSFIFYRHDLARFYIAIALIFNSFFSVGVLAVRTRYIEKMQFSKVASFDGVLALIQYFSLVLMVFILTNEQAYSISFILLGGVGFYLLKGSRLKFIKKQYFLSIFDKSKWLMFSSFITGGIINIPYLLIGVFESSITVGGFYFVNQSIYSFSNLLARPIQTVVLPILNESKRTDVEVNKKFSYLVTYFGFFIILTCLALTTIIDTVIEFIWNDKWLYTIPIFNIALMTVSIRICNVFYWSYTNFVGNWKLKPLLGAIELGILGISIAYICLSTNDVVVISKYIYCTLMTTSIVMQCLLSRFYHIQSLPLSLLQILILFGIIYEQI